MSSGSAAAGGGGGDADMLQPDNAGCGNAAVLPSDYRVQLRGAASPLQRGSASERGSSALGAALAAQGVTLEEVLPTDAGGWVRMLSALDTEDRSQQRPYACLRAWRRL
jgi:hypothetical protein